MKLSLSQDHDSSVSGIRDWKMPAEQWLSSYLSEVVCQCDSEWQRPFSVTLTMENFCHLTFFFSGWHADWFSAAKLTSRTKRDHKNFVSLSCLMALILILVWILANLLTLMRLGGSQTSGSTAPDPAAAWAFRSGPFAACSSSTMEPTARSTASTAAARGQRAGGPATECRVLLSGGRGRGQRFGLHTVRLNQNWFVTSFFFFCCKYQIFPSFYLLGCALIPLIDHANWQR